MKPLLFIKKSPSENKLHLLGRALVEVSRRKSENQPGQKVMDFPEPPPKKTTAKPVKPAEAAAKQHKKTTKQLHQIHKAVKPATWASAYYAGHFVKDTVRKGVRPIRFKHRKPRKPNPHTATSPT